jgi:hypothetical protein
VDLFDGFGLQVFRKVFDKNLISVSGLDIPDPGVSDD